MKSAFLPLLIVGLLWSGGSYAQQYLNLSVDNDLYFGIDRYYSSGVFISMGNLKPVTDKEAAPSKRYAHWTLGQEIYTPSNRYTIDTNKFDYPYGGWLFFGTDF